MSSSGIAVLYVVLSTVLFVFGGTNTSPYIIIQ